MTIIVNNERVTTRVNPGGHAITTHVPRWTPSNKLFTRFGNAASPGSMESLTNNNCPIDTAEKQVQANHIDEELKMFNKSVKRNRL